MKKKKYDFIDLEWDTNYFGVKCARFNINGALTLDEMYEIKNISKKFDFTTITNIGNLYDNNYLITSYSDAFLTDINIQFRKNVRDNLACDLSGISIGNNLPRDANIVDISASSFKYSRFFNDKNLAKDKSQNIYVNWVESAFKKSDKYFVTYEEDGNIGAYILFSIAGDACVIELIAVGEKCQGRGLGTSLILAMENFVGKKGVKYIKVGTQIDNKNAINFYNSIGFSFISCSSVYHLWNNNI